MASRASLNKVLLIGNLTRDPELRYTPSGAAVCTFAVATNRYYVASDGTKKEEAEFIKIVSWNKLAELCSQLLSKGRKVYVEGRLQTRSWETPDGQSRQTTEVVIDDMRILDSKREFASEGSEPILAEEVVAEQAPSDEVPSSQIAKSEEPKEGKTEKKTSNVSTKGKADEASAKKDTKEDIDLEDLPF